MAKHNNSVHSSAVTCLLLQVEGRENVKVVSFVVGGARNIEPV
jgi:hypothetical protein